MTYVYIYVTGNLTKGYFVEWDMSFPKKAWIGIKTEYPFDEASEICEMLHKRGYTTKLEKVPVEV